MNEKDVKAPEAPNEESPQEEDKGEAPKLQEEPEALANKEGEEEKEISGIQAQPVINSSTSELKDAGAFITGSNQNLSKAENPSEFKLGYTIHDLLIPGGKPAKLVKIQDAESEDLRVGEILARLKFRDPTPVIMLIGGWGSRASKVLAGLCRAAYHTDAIILDSATNTGIEKFCIRKGVKLIGVAPENEIMYPKVNPTERFPNELTNGHTHFILIGDKTHEYTWGDEAGLKAELADKIAQGKYPGKAKCKVIGVLLGDNEGCITELKMCHEKNWPVIVIEGSDLSNRIIQYKESKKPDILKDAGLAEAIDKGKFFMVNANSEDLAQLAHLALCISF